MWDVSSLLIWLGVTLLTFFVSFGAGNEIVGCGGFVRSPHKLDFNQIEIKLFSKGGSLKVKTECAPTTGYYFIPLESKADYVLKISPPEGWTFEPSEVAIPFDGVTDPCSLGQDLNFDFKGFSVFGSVLSSGFKEGPAGVGLTLSGPDGLSLSTMTGEKGGFHFDSISPGSYSLQAAHPSLKFLTSKFAFTITNKNVQIDKELVVSGYELVGRVGSDGNPVENVNLVLVSSDDSVQSPKGCGGKGEGLTLPSDIEGRILCVESSDSTGAFKFGGLSPGKYSVVPVYKGTTNIVYNVSPDRQMITLGHGSGVLPKPFEVEGFTVQGRVKGHSGASILVNGILKATSGHDGTFSIPNVKPGTYEFEVTADKFLFEKKQIRIQPTNPIIPDFVPSKFQTCGSLSIVSKSSMPDLTLVFQKISATTATKAEAAETVREKVVDVNQACVYLSQGSWTVMIESRPEKYFTPQKATIQVPSGSRFTFQEFSGSISGNVVTSKSSSPDGVVVRAENKATGVVVQEEVVASDGKFSFLALESGDYRIKIDGTGFCWQSETVDRVELKATNVENIVFVQTGVPLEMESTHSTQVSISGKTPAASQVVQLEGGSVVKVCLSDPNSPPDSYRIIPQGCHTFEKAVYGFTPGTRLNLIARSHQHSWSILAPFKISDLKVTRNGVSTTLAEIKASSTVKIEEKVEAGMKVPSVHYTIISQEEPGRSVEWTVFSYGFIFEPSSFSIDALNDCQTNLLQVVAKQSHVIKGKLTPALEGVEIQIELVGDPDASVVVTSDAKGEYIAGPFVHPSGFRVTPQLVGYIFKALDSDPHSFSVFQLAKIQVVVENKGSPVPGVLLSLSGPSSYRQNRMTDESGKMTFGELGPGDYYLKALLKEFQFQPSAINIELKEQEAKVIQLQAIRESFSLYGQLSSLSGESLPHLLVSAKGKGNCSEYGEEGSSDEIGNFRIWALKSFCTYQVSVAKTEEFANRVERTIPATLEVKIGTEDIGNVSFVVITPVRRMDVSLRIHTNNEKSLDGLKAVVYAAGSEVPLHSTPFNGISYLILPPIPKDELNYLITFESSLNKFQYTFQLPPDITFPASSAYAHFSTTFDIHPAAVDQEIGKNSYIALGMIILVVGLIANYEKVGGFARELLETYASGTSLAKKSKSKTK